MRRLSILVTLLIACLAPPACAQGGLNLNWGGCTADPHASDMTFACNTNTGDPFVLFASVVLPADLPKFAAATCIIAVAFDAPSVPPWWQTGAAQCRSSSSVWMTFDPAQLQTACADLWAGQANLAIFSPSQHTLFPNLLQLRGGAAIPAGNELSLVADGSELNLAKVTITRAKSTGTGSCAGCLVGACLGLTESHIQQPLGFPSYRVTRPATSNVATWRAYSPGHGMCPFDIEVPTRNRTWGAVKGMYR